MVDVVVVLIAIMVVLVVVENNCLKIYISMAIGVKNKYDHAIIHKYWYLYFALY